MTLHREMLKCETLEGLRIRVADCGLRIADCGLRVLEGNAVRLNGDGHMLERGHRAVRRQGSIATLKCGMLQASRGAGCRSGYESGAKARAVQTLARGSSGLSRF
jgi:hypothetical protein